MHIQILRVFKLVIFLLPFLCNAQTSHILNSGSLPEQWHYDSYFTQTIPTDDTWWKRLEDTTLDSLIQLGVDNNYDVRMAAHRIEIARQQLNVTRSDYFPNIGINAGWNRTRTSGMTTREAHPASVGSYWNAGLSMNWQIDVFGKIAIQSKQKKAELRVSRAEYAAVMVTVCADIADTYVKLRMYQNEKLVAQSHAEQQASVVRLTEARHEAGLASKLDVAQAKTVYYSTLALIPPLNANIDAAINTLSVLIGDFPETLHNRLCSEERLPRWQQMVATGLPVDLLRRRPDVVKAEQQLAADAAAVGIAKSDFLPTLSIQGAIGTSAHTLGDTFRRQSLTYSIVPTLTWTVFDGMARKANAVAARQQMEVSIENYNFTLITAMKEVENAMSSYENAMKQLEVIDSMIKNAEEALKLSVDLYKRGLSSFTNVVDAQINYLNYHDQLVTVRGTSLMSLISLYESLGGGWDGDMY